MQIKCGYADTAQGQIHYRTAGDGPPLLMIHQYPRSSRMYLELIPLLAAEHTVYAVDLPGWGNSYAPHAGLTHAECGQVMSEFVDAMGFTQIDVFTVHMGGNVGTELCALRPELVRNFAAFGLPLVNDDAERDVYIDSIPAVLEPWRIPAPDGSHLWRRWSWGYAEISNNQWHTRETPPRIISDRTMEWMDRWMLDVYQGWEHGLDSAKAIFEYEARNRLGDVKARMLHLEADSPFEAPVCMRGARIAELAPNCEYRVIPLSDGNIAEFKPEELAEHLLPFFAPDGSEVPA
jgi:pimeloyl-ACP methyl ester carboxylesterase